MRALTPSVSGPGAVAPGVLGDLVLTARPRQWVKNVLVLAAPGAAGVLLEPGAVLRSIAAVVVFCIASAGCYFLNDTLDIEADRLHPDKRFRPVPAGRISVVHARTAAAVLMAGSIPLAALVRPGLAAVVAAYLALTVAYSVRLKHEPVLDVGAVAAGFMLRAVAGGVANDVAVSPWFLVVTSFGSLLMVSGKRYAERLALGDDAGRHRATLWRYSLTYLRHLRWIASSVAIVGYCLWVFGTAYRTGLPGALIELSAGPFSLAILRYGLVVDAGGGGAPEEVVLGDRPLQLLGLAWVACYGLGVYIH